MISPVVALIGQKNVGKSTLFNKVTHTHDALIANNCLGLTRDRRYGCLQYKLFKFVFIDTGGICGFYSDIDLENCVIKQTMLAIREANIILFVVDGQSVITATDYNIVNFLRKLNKIILVVVNKIDNVMHCTNNLVYEFYDFGIENTIAISAMYGYGINGLLEKIYYFFSKNVMLHKSNQCLFGAKSSIDIASIKNKNLMLHQKCLLLSEHESVVLAVVGRPNSGKSTFVNYVTGEDRVIACNTPGTTRDSVYIPVVYNKKNYILVDTAGIKKNKIDIDIAEQFFILKTLKIIKDVHIILFMIDAKIGISNIDLSLLRTIIKQRAQSLIIVINKWDSLSGCSRNKIKKDLFTKKDFISRFVRVNFISSLYGNGVKNLFKSVQDTISCLVNVYSMNTAYLTRVLHAAAAKFAPPFFHGRRIKLKYAHIGGCNPIILIVHGTYVSKLSYSYKQYLKSFFYQCLNIKSVIFHLEFKDASHNPFSCSMNKITKNNV